MVTAAVAVVAGGCSSSTGSSSTGSSPTSAQHPSANGTGATSVKVVQNNLVDSSGQPMRLLGVDASGTESACIIGKGFSWGPFDSNEAKSIAAWHINAVRVPMNEDCWLGINGAPAAYSGPAYQKAVKKWVAELNRAGLVAILDLHWSAPGTTKATQQWPMPDQDHSVTFWSQVASAFSGDSSVMFDLFNEPYLGKRQPTTADWMCWRDGCTTSAPLCVSTTSTCTQVSYAMAGTQELVTAVRDAGAHQPIILGGLNWAGDPCGVTQDSGGTGTCAWLVYQPVDPLHQLAAGFHTYDWTACNTPACWDESVAPLAAHVPVVTTEFGERDCSANYLNEYMAWADQHNISYLAWGWLPSHLTSKGCSSVNLSLLSSWAGGPSTENPSGPAFHAHLASASTR